MNPKKILFITGTRADFGKIKPLIKKMEGEKDIECAVFVTGMHTLSRYGYTIDEVYKSLGDKRLSGGARNIHTFMNQIPGEPMERILSNTIDGFSRYVHEIKPEMIVVHGDRVESLAGAIVGSLRNILVAHIEGGELSGTIDELIRHAVTKLAHIHFVANEESKSRLRQLGEEEKAIFTIGSPDIDIMLSSDLPQIDEVRHYYEIPFSKYGIVLFHSVTTDASGTERSINALVDVLCTDTNNYVVIFPNNDEGSNYIFTAYERLKGNSRFRFFPSLRIEYFLTLLKKSEFLIGNSSAGIREAPVYGIYSINIDSRQKDRFNYQSIINIEGTPAAIRSAITKCQAAPRCKPSFHFGKGDSADRFFSAIKNPMLWQISKQKQFVDIKN